MQHILRRCGHPLNAYEFSKRALTLEEKRGLVSRHKEEHGLNRCLHALGVSKGTWHDRQKQVERQAEDAAEEQRLKAVVGEIIEENPAYGYRRLLPELEEREEVVHHKRLRRLLNEWDLALMRTVAHPRPSGVREVLQRGAGQLNPVKGWTPEPLEMLSTDFTEIVYAGGRKKAYRMAMLDPASAWVPGWAVGPSANRELALTCWGEVRKHLEKGRGGSCIRTRTVSTPATSGCGR